ncbi:MAG: YciI family protein [Verrucomicrobium sp.]|nr:YciI family protein [Verrucomicrobium sp.]
MKHFYIEITYTAPLEVVAETLGVHRDFLQTGYDQGILLLSGPMNPRTGGFIVGRGDSLEEFQAFMADDPFLKKNVASYRFVEFVPVKHQPFLQEWFGQ